MVAAATMATGAPVAVSDVADGCAGQALEQPFLPWLDPATYVLAPDGALENGGSGWLLTGDAALVSGNESSFVRGPADTTSLSLLDGSSATTPATCISLFHPTLRFFAANSGSPLGTLKVDVLLHDALGNLRTLPIGVISGGSSWQPTPPLPILANLLDLPLLGQAQQVSFRFTPEGPASGWRIDDVYVDPYQGR